VTSQPGVGYGSDEPPTVIVVGHGGGIRSVLSQLIANVADAYPSEDLPNASVACLTASPASRPSVLRLTAWGVLADDLASLNPEDPYALG
jgi:broad specificity phosphatase PhoE